MADPTNPQSAIDIANMAFAKLGVETIQRWDESNERAIVARTSYANLRDEALRGHPWHFARQYFRLTAAVLPDEAYLWENAFDIPPGSVRVWEVQGQQAARDQEESNGWTTIGKQIWTNLADADPETEETFIRCVCIMRVTDVSLYDATFIDAFVERLMAEWAEPVRRKTSLTTKKEETADRKEKRAWHRTSSERSPPRLEADYFVDSR